ncbi:MFS transporter [Amycolatopsis vancoresmycina]|uniref:Major facilitator superfamily protein n=1 Tax=Amycolatopsis vancoresmycina DSM 44592 TaxID=1292037 RepID=R1GEX4_9PSEU|nr:MFS transporter [Amycolatopsis vancoresmycina]EOD69842.1 major facilitator superfamily protein [Amycolatopsis vancoresmycina DSM 44592]
MSADHETSPAKDVEPRPSPFAPFRRRDFRILVAGQSLSTLGDMVYLVALPFVILGAGYATSGLSLTLTGFGVARIVTALPGGALADRFGARLVMLCADLARCAALTTLTVAAVRGAPALGHLVVTGIVLGACEGAHIPAYRSITPALVPDAELTAANSIGIAANLFANVIGPPIGGALVALVAPWPAIGADAFSFAVSALALLAIHRAPAPPDRPGTAGSGSLLGFVRSSPLYRTVLLMTAVLGASVGGTLEVALPVLTRTRPELGPAGYGWLMAALGIGMLGGGASAGALTRGRRQGPLVIATLAVNGGLLAALPHVGGLLPMAATMAVVGALDGVLAVLVMTATQRMPPPRLLARAQGLISLVTFAMFPVSVAAAGLVLGRWSPAAMFHLTGLGFGAVAVCGIASRSLRRL